MNDYVSLLLLTFHLDYNKYFMTVSFVSPRPSMFPEAKPRGTLRSRGNKTHCFPWDQSLRAIMSSNIEPVVAHDEKSKFFIFFPEIAYGKHRNVVLFFS